MTDQQLDKSFKELVLAIDISKGNTTKEQMIEYEIECLKDPSFRDRIEHLKACYILNKRKIQTIRRQLHDTKPN